MFEKKRVHVKNKWFCWEKNKAEYKFHLSNNLLKMFIEIDIKRTPW